MHFQGVIHRDLKPANLMVTDDDHLAIGDFGLAHITEDPEKDQRELTRTVGTPAFMAPELCNRTFSCKTVTGKPGDEPTLCIPLRVFMHPVEVDDSLDEVDVAAPVGKPVDVWALGVTLYCFLYGRLPFGGDNANVYETFQAIRNQPYAHPPRLVRRRQWDRYTNASPHVRRLASPRRRLQFDDNIPVSDEAKDLLQQMMDKNPATRVAIGQVKVCARLP